MAGNAKASTPSVKEVHRFWASAYLSPRGTIGIRAHVSSFHAEIFLFCNSDCLFQGIKFQSEEIGLDWTVYETLHEQRDQRLFIRRIGRDATRKMECVLNLRVYITFALFKF